MPNFDQEVICNAEQKQDMLRKSISHLGNVMVAYSGGVDSSLLAYYARSVLGNNALIVIAKSPSLAQDELIAARAQSRLFEWELVEIETDELQKEEYRQNDKMRCYFCKTTLFEAMSKLARERNINHLAYGANIDDLADFRPGHLAAKEHFVVSPLQEAGLNKDEIRYLAYCATLPSWNRPQAACLSSRIPTFEPITVEKLAIVEKAEQIVRSFGFKQVRVRHYSDTASIEVDKDELKCFDNRPELVKQMELLIKKLGYKQVVIDKEGYRQGSVNVTV